MKNCKAKATTLARSVDTGGRPMKQYELCSVHAEHVAEREKAKGREIMTRGSSEQAMNIRHTAVLVLVGWYLMSPPLIIMVGTLCTANAQQSLELPAEYSFASCAP